MAIGTPRFVRVLFISLACAAITGCNRAGEQKTEAKPALEKVAERGPIRLKVSVDKDRVAVAESLRLTIEVSAPDGFEVTMPSPGETLESLVIKNAKEPPNVAIDGARQWRREYELESLVSGEQIIPAMTIRYHESQQTASAPTPSTAVEGELSSEPLTIQVASALTGDVDPGNLEHLRDIKGTVDVPLAGSRRWAIWMAAGVAALALLVGILSYRTKRCKKTVAPVPPGAWAFSQLRILEGDRLIEQGLYHAFYSRLSDIVRQYIERQFGLMAPERTTEEFLREVRHNPLLLDRHQQLLRDFLEAADMVKFALYEPGRDEAERAFTAARDFVEETAYEERRAEPALETATV